MKLLFSLFITTVLCQHLHSQEKVNSIEVFPYFRHSNHGSYEDWYGRSFSTKLTLKGNSYGVNAYYARRLSGNWQARIGIGYFRYAFNKMSNYDERMDGSTYPQRPFDNPHPDAILFYTDSYWYNTGTVGVGADRIFPLSGGWELSAGAYVNAHYTFSQMFKVTYDNYTDYRRKSSGYFGFSASLNTGITKNIGKYFLGPRILIPVFDQWKQDKIFREPENESRNKWFSGIGGGIALGYRL